MGLSKIKKISLYLIIIVAGLILGALASFFSILYLSLPQTDGSLVLDKIHNDIEITYDKMGIPQIWAEDDYDGYFALGYMHASDRLFQMELVRRVAYGRISELLGDAALIHDKRQRLMGHYLMADMAIKKLDEKNKNRLQAYVDGINTYQKKCRALPIEFYLMQIEYEEWTVHNCLTILSFQSWFSDALMNRDLYFVKVAEKIGIEKTVSLIKDYPDWAPATIDNRQYGNSETDRIIFKHDEKSILSRAGNVQEKSLTLKEELTKQLFAGNRTPFTLSVSSNGWAVAPIRSESNQAMLASDPHLEITRLPEFWYYAGLHIKASNTNIAGISTPGLPFIVMGHNGRAAFCFTAGGVDITEYYLEKINPDDSNEYLTETGYKRFITRIDNIKIAGHDEPFVYESKSTRHGPVISELDSLREIYSIRWAGFDIDLERSVKAGFDLHTVDNFENFRETVTSLGALDVNWMYADFSGNIGYQLGTPVPIRQKPSNNLPLTGWSVKNEWLGFYPIDMTPHVLNPSQGWVGNCNNLSKRNEFPYKVYGNYFPDRILRLNELFSSKDKFSVADFRSMQMDLTDKFLLRWRDIIKEVFSKIGDINHAERLSKWNGMAAVDSRETLLIEIFLGQLKKNMFEDELGELYNQIRYVWMDQIYHSDDSSWFDDITTEGIVETKEEICQKALFETLEILDPNKQMASDPKYYEHIIWGNWQTLTIQHPMAVVPILSSLLDLKFGPWNWGGTAGTLNASFFIDDDNHRFKSFVGPSWRFIIDFADIDAASIVLPAGNSGNPYSDHFFDFNEMWRNGERWQVPFTRKNVKEKAVSSLILEPIR